MKNQEHTIEVAEAIQADIDKGLARLSSKTMKSLGLVSGLLSATLFQSRRYE